VCTTIPWSHTHTMHACTCGRTCIRGRFKIVSPSFGGHALGLRACREGAQFDSTGPIETEFRKFIDRRCRVRIMSIGLEKYQTSSTIINSTTINRVLSGWALSSSLNRSCMNHVSDKIITHEQLNDNHKSLEIRCARALSIIYIGLCRRLCDK
jgi:hypothetical protein